MQQYTLIITFILMSFLCLGQKEHLEPAKDFKEYEFMLKDYYDNVFPLLYKGYSEKPIARYTSMPSFNIEYSFSIEIIESKLYIVSNSLSENYWYSANRNQVKSISSKAEIDNNLFSRVGKLFQILNEQTRKYKKDSAGCDGVTYYFTTTDVNGQIKIGKTWSPPNNSMLHRLIKICDNLYFLGNGKNVSRTAILEEVNKLISDLK